MANDREDVREKQAQRIIEMIENDLASGKNPLPPWRKTWSGAELMPRNAISDRPYRGGNLMMLGMAPYGLPHFVTFNQAVSHGGVVVAKEKGWPVHFWKFQDKKDKDDKDDDKKRRWGFCVPYTVFNVEQCRAMTDEDRERFAENPRWKDKPVGSAKQWENLLAKLNASIAPTGKKHNPIKAAEKIHKAYKDRGGPTVKFGGARAFYMPSKDLVQLPPVKSFNRPEDYHLTRLHEETHSSGHTSRLARDGITDMHMFGDHNYAQEELVAEFGASMLASVCGIARATEENSAAYLKNWLGKLKSEPSVLYKAAQQAQKATDLILGKNEDETGDNGKEDSEEKAA